MALTLIFRSFMLAIRQLSDPRFRRVFFLGLGLALVLLYSASAGVVWLVDWAVGDSTTLPGLGEVTWLDNVAVFGSALITLAVSVFVMIPVASAITSLFLDTVADAVEAEHYPHLPKAAPVSWGDTLRDTVNFLGVLLAANVLALVLYIFLAPFAPIIFWGLNGFLMGREYFTLAAIRRVGRIEATRLRRHHMVTIWAAGVLMAVPLSVPLLNLIVPILGAATFTHLFHQVASVPREAGVQRPPR